MQSRHSAEHPGGCGSKLRPDLPLPAERALPLEFQHNAQRNQQRNCNRFIADFNGQTTTPAVPHFNLFTGKDAFEGKNINAIVIEFPIKMLLAPGSPKLAAWAVTYLGDLRNDEDTRGDLRHDDDGKHLGE